MLRFRIIGAGALLTAGLLAGCSNRPEAPPVADNIRTSLKQAGIKDVSVSQDRNKGVVTLTGNVSTQDVKTHAQQIAQSVASSQVVANEVAVVPPNDRGAAKDYYSDIDKAIDKNLDAALISGGYRSGIHHSEKNGVITLTGNVDNENQRQQVQTIAQNVPNTQQVINELQTTHERATSN
jgi:hyperosmotically inducible periplasmic protein